MEMGLNDYRAFDATDAGAALRPLGWSELCARLVAAQDYRRGLPATGTVAIGMAAPADGGLAARSRAADARHLSATGVAPGSFHGGTARMLEHFEKGNPAVNSNSSTYGKDSQGTPVDSRQTSLSAFAERQADENSHD